MRRKRYDPERVTVSLKDDLPTAWSPFGGQAVLGRVRLYDVHDANFDRFNHWVFSVHVPAARGGRVIVQPQVVPAKKAWAALDRRSIVFVPATKRSYRGSLYCKLNVADPTAGRTKIGISRRDRKLLPAWFERFQGTFRVKSTVATTRGTDADALVALVRRDDDETMIRLFFALKVWVVAEGVVVGR